jgi:hypothetical protein
VRGPVTTVSLQRLTKVWYVLGARSDGIRVVSPRPQDTIGSPLGVLASVTSGAAVVPVRVTQDRYGKDLELGSAYLTRQAESPDLAGQVAFRRPSGPTGSVIFTTVSGHNGEVWSAAVIRVRFATGQPPQILAVRSSPPLVQRDGWLQLPEAVTFQVTATRVTRARLVLTPTGTGTAWSSSVVAEDRTAGDGLRLTWHPERGTLGHLSVEVLGPGGTAGREIGGVHRE